jgi:hypothetical protein
MTKTPNFHGYHIRKWYLQIEDNLAGELQSGVTAGELSALIATKLGDSADVDRLPTRARTEP